MRGRRWAAMRARRAPSSPEPERSRPKEALPPHAPPPAAICVKTSDTGCPTFRGALHIDRAVIFAYHFAAANGGDGVLLGSPEAFFRPAAVRPVGAGERFTLSETVSSVRTPRDPPFASPPTDRTTASPSQWPTAALQCSSSPDRGAPTRARAPPIGDSRTPSTSPRRDC